MHRFLLTIRAGFRGIGFPPVKTVPRRHGGLSGSQWICRLSQSVVVLATIIICSGANADDHFDAIDDFLTDDVVAVAYLDVTPIDADAILALCEQLGFVGDDERGYQERLGSGQRRIE